jgi:hypothetical protein
MGWNRQSAFELLKIQIHATAAARHAEPDICGYGVRQLDVAMDVPVVLEMPRTRAHIESVRPVG